MSKTQAEIDEIKKRLENLIKFFEKRDAMIDKWVKEGCKKKPKKKGKMKFECEACKTCDEWNRKDKRCDFTGICEYPVDPKLIERENQLLEH